jgi:hypothetical protein
VLPTLGTHVSEAKQSTPTDHPYGLLSQVLGVLRRPLLGPLLFGMMFGGIPFAILLSFRGIAAMSTNLYAWLSPAAIVLAALSAELSMNRTSHQVLWRAFLTSFAICVPVQAIVWPLLAWHLGYEVFDPRNFPFNVSIFVLWAIAITIPSWLLVLGYGYLKSVRSRRAMQM